MRVSFEHAREGKHFLLTSTVEFSEEERAIIDQRGFASRSIGVGPSAPFGSSVHSAGYSSLGLQTASRLCLLGGFLSIPTSMFHVTPEVTPVLLFILSPAIYIFRKISEQRNTKSFEERRLKLKTLLNDPTIKSYATDLPHAKVLEENIRNQLSLLKEEIKESATMPAKQTYEL